MPFVKGKSGNPKGKPVGIKNRTTLLKEERRAVFDEEVSQRYINIISNARPEYLLDQFLGKAPDKIEHSGEIKTGSVSAEILALAEAELKKRRTHGTG